MDEAGPPEILAALLGGAFGQAPQGSLIDVTLNLGEIQRRGAVRVLGALADADAPEAATVGAGNLARLLVRPARPTRRTLALATDFHSRRLRVQPQ